MKTPGALAFVPTTHTPAAATNQVGFGYSAVPNKSVKMAQAARIRQQKLALAMTEGQGDEPRPLFRMPPAELRNCSNHFPKFNLEELETNITQVVNQVQGTADELRKKGGDATQETIDRAKHVADPLKELGQEIAHNITKGLPEPSDLTQESLQKLKESKFGESSTSYISAVAVQLLKNLGLKADSNSTDQ